ncbi:MAG: efflux RND transporter periplasmic adaptor subunit [Candidatus Promineifilaceae bacterium]
MKWLLILGHRIGFLVCMMAVCALVLTACSFGVQGAASSEATPTPLPTPVVPEKPVYAVEQGTVVNTLEFTGRVSPVLEQALFFKSDGFVAEVYFDRGDQVAEGDLLAELEIGDLQNRLAQQQLALRTAELTQKQAEEATADQLLEAQINLDKLKLQLEREQASPGSGRTTAAAVSLEAAQRELDAAQDAYDTAWEPARDWELNMTEPSCLPGQGGAVPCTGLPLRNQLENERAATDRRLAMAQDSLAIARADYSDAYASRSADVYSVQILEKDIELAEHRIEQLQRGTDPLLALDMERTRLEIAATNQQINDAQLIAPFDGEILSVALGSGDTANAFRTVIVLADPGALEVTAELGADQLREMGVGQAATISLRSRPEVEMSGFVRQLPYPYGGGTTEASEDDTAVRIAFDDPDVPLEMGELASVVIVLEEKSDALWLPPAAIRTFQGRNFVVVQDEDGSQRRVDVRLGIENEERVEILEGLERGQMVVGE